MQMSVMIFGAVYSPYVDHEVRKRNTQEFQKMNPDECDAIMNKYYMNNITIAYKRCHLCAPAKEVLKFEIGHPTPKTC